MLGGGRAVERYWDRLDQKFMEMKSPVCHNHRPQPSSDTKGKSKKTESYVYNIAYEPRHDKTNKMSVRPVGSSAPKVSSCGQRKL